MWVVFMMDDEGTALAKLVGPFKTAIEAHDYAGLYGFDGCMRVDESEANADPEDAQQSD